MVKREDITDHTSIRGWVIATSCHGVGLGWTCEKVFSYKNDRVVCQKF